jgi:hypothetical protein
MTLTRSGAIAIGLKVLRCGLGKINFGVLLPVWPCPWVVLIVKLGPVKFSSTSIGDCKLGIGNIGIVGIGTVGIGNFFAVASSLVMI